MNANAATGAPSADDRAFFGHPRGLITLFLTEMWERFSFYGMRAILVLFLTASTADGGLGMSVGEAAAIYGLYNALVYVFSLPGGWIADRLTGQRHAVMLGGIVIAVGHFLMVPQSELVLFVGMGFIVLGTGLLKPNITSIVGGLYAPDDPRRDSGFSLYYMGINLGAFIAPLIVGYLGQEVGWHIGFAAAGVGMLLGLVQYQLGQKHLGDVRLHPGNPLDIDGRRRARKFAAIGVVGAGLVVLFQLFVHGFKATDIETFADVLIVAIPIAWFVWSFRRPGLTAVGRHRLSALAILFIASACFWLVYDQAGSTLSVFAEDNTKLEMFGVKFPSSWFQSVNPIFILALAPLMAWLWIHLGKRQPSTPIKFSIGLFLVGVSFFVMVGAASAAGSEGLASPWWLIGVYFIQTIGELTLSPVGLSAASKLAPAATVGTTMGVWFLSISVGDVFGGRLADLYTAWGKEPYFAAFGAFLVVAALVMLLLSKRTAKLMDGVE